MKNLRPAGVLSVNRHASPGIGSVNTWWIETRGGVVLFDAQRQMSQAVEVARTVALLGKPVAAILLTHPHPDHVGGLPVLHEAFPDAAIAASARTAEALRGDEGGLLALTRSFLGADFAAELPAVTMVLPERGEVELAGLGVNIHELGIGETVAATVFELAGAGLAVVGDVVANAMTPWLVEGRTGAWLTQLDRLAALFPAGTTAHPGHGEAAGAMTLANAQRRYLLEFRQRVADAATNGRLTPEAKRAVVTETARLHPGWVPVAGTPDLLGANAEAVARELGLEVTA